MSAASVGASTVSTQETGPGASPRAALHALHVSPIPYAASRDLLSRCHYLHSIPGGTKLCFGVFLENRLLGAVTLGVGPFNAHSLVRDASPDDCLTLTRLWLSDELPANSESRVIGVLLRSLRKYTSVKFLLAYADPAQGHRGGIYQATGWLYTGLSSATPLYDLGDGVARHSRSLAHAFGTHSVDHFSKSGLSVTLLPQSSKHRYVYFLDGAWRPRLLAPALPYPKKEPQ